MIHNTLEKALFYLGTFFLGMMVFGQCLLKVVILDCHFHEGLALLNLTQQGMDLQNSFEVELNLVTFLLMGRTLQNFHLEMLILDCLDFFHYCHQQVMNLYQLVL